MPVVVTIPLGRYAVRKSSFSSVEFCQKALGMQALKRSVEFTKKFGYTDQKGWCILYLNEFLVLATKFRFVDAQLLCNKHRVFSMAGKNLDFYNIF